jgi:hypothetical protein
MGLDMYLTKHNYVKNWNYMGDNEKHNVIVTKNGEPVSHIKSERISYITEQVGYWRKANHIHKWFVNNVQKGADDCGEYSVYKEDLEKLLSICKQVMEDYYTTGGIKAHELLPTSEGFFFGNTDYDEYYFGDVEKTIKILEEVLSEVDERGYIRGDIYYSSSW